MQDVALEEALRLEGADTIGKYNKTVNHPAIPSLDSCTSKKYNLEIFFLVV